MSKDKKNKVSIKQTLAYDDAVAYLEDIVKNFKSGKIVLENEEKSVTLTPADEINFELKAGCKRGKNKLNIKLSWKEETNKTDELNISGNESNIPTEKTKNMDNPKENKGKPESAKASKSNDAPEKTNDQQSDDSSKDAKK